MYSLLLIPKNLISKHDPHRKEYCCEKDQREI